jgi:16S rRNA G966 N2-methylase RsmD
MKTAPEILPDVLSSIELRDETPTGREVQDIIREAKIAALPEPTPHKDVSEKAIQYISFRDAELILTDPPYPREYLPLWDELFERAEEGLKEGGFLVTYAPHIHLKEIFAKIPDTLTYVWTIAQIHTGGRTSYHPSRVNIGWKPILVFVKGEMPDIEYYDDVLQGTGREKDDHEWQQAVGEAERLIQIFTTKGGLVVDPFVGSGTVAVAAQRTGRNFKVYDIDPMAIKTTLTRLENDIQTAISRPIETD